MPKSGYENLDICKLAEQLATLVYETVKHWPRFDRDTIGRQIVRAADSIGANIAEGYGRGRGQDQMRFLRIARGSVYETKYWLRLAFTRSLLNETEVEPIKQVIDVLPKQLNGFMKFLKRPFSTTYHTPHTTNQ